MAAIGPSVASVYDARLSLDRAVCVTISQSGGSPDLVSLQDHARAGGAATLALLNTPDSPVGSSADEVVPVMAGPETAVAATKSLVASLFAIAGMVAGWTEDEALAYADWRRFRSRSPHRWRAGGSTPCRPWRTRTPCT